MHPNTKRAALRRAESYALQLENFWRDLASVPPVQDMPEKYWRGLPKFKAMALRTAMVAARHAISSIDDLQYALEEFDEHDNK